MSLRTVLLVAASVLIASPELAMAKSKTASSDPILNHSGPISYAELQEIHKNDGYNSRSKKGHRTTAATDSGAVNPSSTGVDTPAPSTAVNPPLAAPAAPAPGEAVNPSPPSAPPSPTPPPAATPPQ